MSQGDRSKPRLCGPMAAALVAIGVYAAVVATPDIAAGGATAPRDAGTPVAVCTAAIQHPIDVRVRPLDPVRRGASVRLEVRTAVRSPLGDAELRLVSPGGAIVSGASRLALGRLAPGREATGTFRVTLPDQGTRFLVQFVVTGEGPTGPLTRGAVYNLLPDGPADPGRDVTTAGGVRVREFAAARSGR